MHDMAQNHTITSNGVLFVQTTQLIAKSQRPYRSKCRQQFAALFVVLLQVVQSIEVGTSMYYPDHILTKVLESVPRFDSPEQEELSQVSMQRETRKESFMKILKSCRSSMD
jgi:hypothetical protein